MLELVEKEKVASENLKSYPPKTIFKSHPTVLVSPGNTGTAVSLVC